MISDVAIYFGQIAALFAVSVIAGKVLGPVMTRILEKLAGKTQTTLDDRIIAAIKTPLETFAFLIIFFFLLHSFPELSEAAAFLARYTYAIVVLITAFMLSEASGAAINWYREEGYKEGHGKLGVDLSLLPLVRKVTKIAIYAVGVTMALAAMGFDITGLLAVTSIAGIILGLASQETLGNVFAGIALQMDRPFQHGDSLRLPSGEIVIVRKIGMRSTRLEDLHHNTIFISNSEFAKMRITNLNLPDKMGRTGVSAELAHGADLGKLKARIISALSKEKPEGLEAGKGYSHSIDSVKPVAVSFTFYFWAKGYENSQAIREIVNREILSFAKGKGKKN